MARKVLGNDPFLRGAALRTPARAPASGSRTPVPAAAEPETTPVPAPAEAESTPAPAAAPTAPGPATPPLPRPKVVRRRGAKTARPAAPPVPRAKQARPVPARTGTDEREAGLAGPRREPAAAGVGSDEGHADRAAIRPDPADARTGPARPESLPPPAVDPADFAGDGGLLPDDLASAPPAPRVVAVAPLPERRALPAPRPGGPLAVSTAEPVPPAAALRGGVAVLRRLSRLDRALPSLEVDEFGRDPAFEREVRPFLAWMYQRWFRVEERGLDRLPRSGPLILVANRAGAIPWDAAMVAVAAARQGREVRPLIEDPVFHFPFLGVLVNRLGGVRACPENAERLLGGGGAIAVFPEGAPGFGKPFRERYRLLRFGRGGFVKLALRTGAKIVPVAVIGSEETYPLLGKIPARPLGVPWFPITPTWPWLGAAGLLPLPSKWSIEMGEPLDLSGLGPEAAGDDPTVLRIAENVRATVQAMLDSRLAERTRIF